MGSLTPCNTSPASGGQNRRSIIWIGLLLSCNTSPASCGQHRHSIIWVGLLLGTRLLQVVVNTDAASYGSAYSLQHVSCWWWSTQTQHHMDRLTPCNMSPASGGQHRRSIIQVGLLLSCNTSPASCGQHRRSIIWVGLLLGTRLLQVVVNTDVASYGSAYSLQHVSC